MHTSCFHENTVPRLTVGLSVSQYKLIVYRMSCRKVGGIEAISKGKGAGYEPRYDGWDALMSNLLE